MPEDREHPNQRRHPRIRLELPVEAQIDGGGYREMQILDISPQGLQLWCNELEHLQEATEGDDVVTFEIRFNGRAAWARQLEDGSFLTGGEILVDDEDR